jgi:hypothetical protein
MKEKSWNAGPKSGVYERNSTERGGGLLQKKRRRYL